MNAIVEARSSSAMVVACLVLFGCGGRSLSEPMGSDANGTQRIDPPVGECQNRVVHRYEPDGEPALTGRFVYDAEGRIILYDETRGDGALGYSAARTFDERGRLVRQRGDSDGDGQTDRFLDWAYDETGWMVWRRYQNDLHPDRNTTLSLSRDAEGWPLLEEWDDGSDGTTDELVHYRYDDGPPLVFEVWHDTDADGVDDWAWRYQLDDRGRVQSIENLRPEGVVQWERFFYDEAGQLIRRELDGDGDDEADYVDVHERDGEGRRARSTYDDDLDGLPELIVTFERDDDGLLLARHYDAPEDSYLEGTFTLAYDDRGRFVQMGQIPPGETSPLRTWTVDYGCEADRSIVVRRSPIYEWHGFADSEDYVVDVNEWWWFSHPPPI
ncbi:MAG: hypothetical protein JRI23_03700 [Deltaproteobacteria bacterium]|jgi:hypothetical protein|nr:hypothetical protein [Deltaproteobacteria bacterium]MBW2530623.1 hypothetical protein [Deltaproteobacteria bacterium]